MGRVGCAVWKNLTNGLNIASSSQAIPADKGPGGSKLQENTSHTQVWK